MKYSIFLFLFLLASVSGTSRTITIGPGGDYAMLELANDEIIAGDTVLIQNGTYSDGTQFLYDLEGDFFNPILIIAEDEHQVIFSGGTEAIHLVRCSYVILDGLVITQQTGNGINIDDGGDYTTPTHHIIVRNCLFMDMDATGNNDFLKLSGLDLFLVQRCSFINGGQGGSGVDMVGCHNGQIYDCIFDNAGVTGIQAKGGTQFIKIARNTFSNISQRAINIGGSTGLQFFRPPLPDPIEDAFESADIEVFSNVFIGNWAPIAFVGTVRSKVFNNTIYNPDNWVFRILQETTEEGFLPCSDNEFFNNIIYLESDITEVNIGSNTDAESFFIDNNVWYNDGDPDWEPILPVSGMNRMIQDPLFVDKQNYDFHLEENSICIGNGITLDIETYDFEENEFNNPPSIGAFEGLIISGSSEFVPSNKISVSPNPTSGYLSINNLNHGDKIEIINANGLSVLSQNARRNSEIRMDVGYLPQGIYVVNVFDSDSVLIHQTKIIKI